ncbi:hypothetical protein ACLOJK_029656, partial [Asimina triloba]
MVHFRCCLFHGAWGSVHPCIELELAKRKRRNPTSQIAQTEMACSSGCNSNTTTGGAELAVPGWPPLVS